MRIVILSLFLFCGFPVFSNIYYVDVDGLGGNPSNSNPGTLSQPWKSLQYAVNQLAAGDILNIRGGKYYENIYINCGGTAAQPITIRGYADEEVVIDGSIPYYQAVPNNEWELVDANINLYRSVRTYNPDYYVAAWLTAHDKQILEYDNVNWMETTRYNETTAPVYCGPGLDIRADGKIYIRLEQNPYDLYDADGNPLADIPYNKNPNFNPIAIFVRIANYCQIIRLTAAANNLVFKNLKCYYNDIAVYSTVSNENIVFDNCDFKYRRYGFLISDASNIQIKNCKFDNGFPEWVSWGDVKIAVNGVRPALPELQSFAICLGGENCTINNNEFHDMMDGIILLNGASNFSIYDNYFYRIRDDAINVRPGVFNIDIHDNVIRHAMEGISMVGEDSESRGSVYIHHNIIDCSKLQFAARPVQLLMIPDWGWNKYAVASPFGKHTNNFTDLLGYWKIYNNTVIGVGNGSGDGGINSHIDVDENFHVLNNIFYNIDDRPVFSDHYETTGAFYDGNILWNNGGYYLFKNFGVSDYYFSSLSEYTGTWEENGLEIDPAFDLAAIASNVYMPLEDIKSFYRPTDYRVFGLGATYSSFTWPDLDRGEYRGASAPRGGYWKFDEISGNAAKDSSGNNDDGTIYGADRISEGTINGLEFSDGDYVNCGTGDNVNLTDSVTVSAWIKWYGRNNSSANRIVELGDKVFMLWVYGGGASSANKIGFGINGVTAGHWVKSSASISLNEWVHIVAVYDRQTIQLYINGVPDNCISLSEYINTNSNILFVSDASSYTSFNGIIDEVFICEDALSDEDVASLYSNRNF